VSIELRLRIEELNARTAAAIDDDRLEDWPTFFTEAGRYRVTTAENFAAGLPLSLIYATSRAMLRDRVKSLREANIYEAQRYRHLVGAPLVERVEGGIAVARASFIVARIMHTGETMLFATGNYHDRLALDEPDGNLRYAERVVVTDSRQFDTLLALPL
jgi:anthranilate 1,2-dioxygenase small subunit/terephthalate 1,2-dioxygenase oxygenase component beta subunit